MNRVIPVEWLRCPDCGGGVISKLELMYQCSECGRAFPVEHKIINLLPENLAQNKLNENNQWLNITHPPYIEFVLKRDSICSFREKILSEYKFTGKLLEIGAGCCWASALVKLSSSQAVVIATDVSPAALETGAKVCRMLEADVDYFVAADAERLPFQDNLFDYVLGSAVIHHFLDAQKGLSEVYRVLKGGGLYIGVNEGGTSSPLRLLRDSRLCPKGRTRRPEGILENTYTWGEWTKLFTSSGFKDIHIYLNKEWYNKVAHHWYSSLYYRVISLFPDSAVRLLACAFNFTAKKPLKEAS